jgi:hypothetical protein
MSFQAYIDNIKAKTGKGPDDFRNLAVQKGFVENGQIKPGNKAGEIVKWLKADFALGHGHAMAIYALLKGVKKENSDVSKARPSGKSSTSKAKAVARKHLSGKTSRKLFGM